jgi:demethylmenaquinone methyltransferase/2-methoxy-6-polyprenyl-1,4-benzoquinol methylase
MGAAAAAVPVGREMAEETAHRLGWRRREERHWGAFFLGLLLGTAAGAIVAFGARNLADLDAGIAEAARVLRDGGTFVILEFSTPRVPIFRTLYRFYFHHVLPVLGRVVSRHPTAYRYLPTSVDNFPNEGELALRMTRAGFAEVRVQRLTFGVAAIHAGVRRRSATGAAA